MAKKSEPTPEGTKKPYIKHYGRHPEIRELSDEGVEMYLSYAKNLAIFVEDNVVIEFENKQYHTNDKVEIDFLNSHKALGNQFWHREYPADVISKFKKDAKYLTRVEDDFSSTEE